MWRMRQFFAILRSFFNSCLLCIFSCHPSPPTILSSSLTSSCHLFLCLPLSLVFPKSIYNTLLGILFSSILCTCPNQHNLFNIIVENKMPTRCNRLDFTAKTYCPLNMFWAPLCPSSRAQELYRWLLLVVHGSLVYRNPDT